MYLTRTIYTNDMLSHFGSRLTVPKEGVVAATIFAVFATPMCFGEPSQNPNTIRRQNLRILGGAILRLATFLRSMLSALPLVLLSLDTGMRLGESQTLRRRDLLLVWGRGTVVGVKACATGHTICVIRSSPALRRIQL